MNQLYCFKSRTFLLALSFLLLLPSLAFRTDNTSPEAYHLIKKMYYSVMKGKGYSYILKNAERINGKILKGEQLIKYSMRPEKCYVKFLKPVEGAELLYVSVENDGQVIYCPNGFPYVNLDLDPAGALMRKNNHHKITDLGFEYMLKLLLHVYQSEYFETRHMGQVKWNGLQCEKLVFENKNFHYREYTVKEGEDLSAIAEKLFLSDYMILEANPSLDFYDDVREGQSIQLPSSYASLIEVYVDRTTHLPVFQKIYDDKGLFEMYEIFNLKVNPAFKAAEFTEGYLGKN